MSGTRVHDLAKQLGMESKALLADLKKLGIAVKSHSSTLDDDTVQTVTKKLVGAQPAAQGATKPAAKKAAVVTRDGKPAPASVEDPPKADKKRLLFQKKKDDELVAEPETAPQPMSPMHPAPQPVVEPEGPAAVVEQPTPAPAPASAPAQTAAPIAAPAAPAPAADIAGRKKPELGPVPDEGLKDKLKTSKKAGRVKDED
ncbi:MAG: translation initiation factor IF-2 N-terminal domain-containing protein, partial [Nitrospira sp.]